MKHHIASVFLGELVILFLHGFFCNGAVDQGKLDDGRKVAVKQLSVGKSGQGESEFFVEVNMITSIQHKNLVRLVGCCSEGSQRLLVYEFMKNKSLDKILFGKHEVPVCPSSIGEEKTDAWFGSSWTRNCLQFCRG